MAIRYGYPPKGREDVADAEAALARVVTYALSAHGKRWADLTPLDIASTVLSSDFMARVKRDAYDSGFRDGRAER